MIECLICDDAPQFNWITAELALCWIHEFRHYKKLLPKLPFHQKQLDVIAKDFWKLYHQLLDYQQCPSPPLAEKLLRVSFIASSLRRRTGPSSTSNSLGRPPSANRCCSLSSIQNCSCTTIRRNWARANGCANATSGGLARTRAGIAAWDTFQTLGETASSMGVNIYRYFHDRVSEANALPSLACLITERAKLSPLGASWQPTAPVVG